MSNILLVYQVFRCQSADQVGSDLPSRSAPSDN